MVNNEPKALIYDIGLRNTITDTQISNARLIVLATL
jgi:hypothetical protein